jgi:hypothetical protein
MSDKQFERLFAVLAVSAVLMLCASLLIVAWRLGAALVSSFMLTVFQWVITLAAVLLIGAIVASVLGVVYEKVMIRIGRLERQYAELLARFAERKPGFISAATVIAALVAFLADKSFESDKLSAACVGIVLIVLFWISNELLLAEGKTRYYIGLSLWILGIAVTPAVILIQRHGDLKRLAAEVAEQPTPLLVTVAVSILIACVAPLTMKERTGHGSAPGIRRALGT